MLFMYQFRSISLLSMLCISLQGFQTVNQAQETAKELDEKAQTTFNVPLFKKLLSTVTQSRENNGFNGRFLQRITPYPGTTMILWGPLKGAFPSLVRSISYLEQQGIIDTSFTIKDPETYFVFNGDVINSSPHALETLSVVLALMNANPQKVIYLRGSVEDNLNWQNDSLKSELKQKMSTPQRVRIPLERELTNFFNTLPLALYLTEPNPQDGALRISYHGRDNKEIQETACKQLFTQKSFNVSHLCYLGTPSKGPDPVKAIIKAELRLMNYDHHPGLVLVEPDRGAVAWNIFSGPSSHYQNEYSFYYDAFARITFGKNLNDSTITLYRSDTRTSKPISLIATYTLLTGVSIPQSKRHSKESVSNKELQSHLQRVFQDISRLLSETTRLRDAIATLKEPEHPPVAESRQESKPKISSETSPQSSSSSTSSQQHSRTKKPGGPL